MRKIFFALVPMALFLVNDIAIGETAVPASPEALVDLPLEELVNVKIITASKKFEKPEEAPATVYVITHREIRSRGYATLADVLRDLPGMEIVENYFSEQGTLVPVRGVVGNNKIVILVNGVRINPPGGEDVMIRSDLSVRMAEQIEVIYGPGSTLYGQDAISAVINIITKKPVDNAHGEGLLSYGNREYKEAFASMLDTVNPGTEEAVRISSYAHFTNSDLADLSDEYVDWWQTYEPVRAETGQSGDPKRRDRGANAFIRAENHSSSLQIWYRDSLRSSSEGGFAPVLQYVNQAKWHDRSLVVEGRNKMNLSDKTALNSSLTYNRYEIDPETRYVFPVGDQLFLNDFKYGLGTGTTLEENIDYSVTEALHVIAGVVASDFRVLPKATIPGGADTDGDIVSQAGSVVYFTEPGDPSSRQVVSRAVNLDYQNYGAYLEANYKVIDPLTLIGGLRLDSNTRFDDRPFSPRAAAVYTDPDRHITAKYIFSKAYVAPAPYYGFNVFDNGVALNVSNPDLEPEKATANEVNLSWNNESWLLGTSAYYNKQSNLLLVGDLALPPNIIDQEVYLDEGGTQKRLLTHTVNSGRSTTKGFELYSRYSGRRASLWGSYSYVDANYTLGGMRTGLPQISRSNVRLGVTLKLLENLSFTPSMVWRSTPANVTNTSGLGDDIKNPYEFNAHLLYSPIEDWDVYVMIRNLTDNRYALKGIITPTPQDGISVRAGVRYNF